ncbi:MAG: hypothetical protein NC489_28690 [Ruminococcus flavefaciens]|nr:hypothetical protein [Ruminococcus flavefaciens]
MGILKQLVATKCTVVVLYLLIRTYKLLTVSDVLRDKDGNRIGWQYITPFSVRLRHALFSIDIACLEGIEAYGFLSGSVSRIPFWFGVLKVVSLAIFFVWAEYNTFVQTTKRYAFENGYVKYDDAKPPNIWIDPDMNVPIREYIWPIVVILVALAVEVAIVIAYAVNIQL